MKSRKRVLRLRLDEEDALGIVSALEHYDPDLGSYFYRQWVEAADLPEDAEVRS